MFAGCNSVPETLPEAPAAVADISKPPPVAAADQKYSDVFSMLDGKWEGVFYIYEDSLGQREGTAQPRNIRNLEFTDLGLRLVQEIEVTQEYVSESPYFQRVHITDVYTDENGEQRVVESEGVNKIQNGHLWCVVKKPDETIVHHGFLDGEDTIIWQRNLKSPLKIEYFRETVEGDFYKIWGWGYYGDDDPTLTPRLWFIGDYNKVELQ